MRKENWFLSRLSKLWKEKKQMMATAYLLAVVLAALSLGEHYLFSPGSKPHVKAETVEVLAAQSKDTENQAFVQADNLLESVNIAALNKLLVVYPLGQTALFSDNISVTAYHNMDSSVPGGNTPKIGGEEVEIDFQLFSAKNEETEQYADAPVQILDDLRAGTEKKQMAEEARKLEEAKAAEEKAKQEAAEKEKAAKEKEDREKAEKKAAEKKMQEEVREALSLGERVISISDEEVEVLQRIVEAEATGEDVKGRILVANVVLNRVENKCFPDSVEEVVFQKSGSNYQFSPIRDKRYWSVTVTKETVEAVERALAGEDYSDGALYFAARRKASKKNMDWFDTSLTYLFKYGNHEFFK